MSFFLFHYFVVIFVAFGTTGTEANTIKFQDINRVKREPFETVHTAAGILVPNPIREEFERERIARDAMAANEVCNGDAVKTISGGVLGQELPLDATYQEHVLARFNSHRASENAVNMTCLKWNEQLAWAARKEANECALQTTGDDTVLASASLLDPNRFVDELFAKRSLFTYPGSCEVPGDCASYVQSAWSGATEIGCAAAQCCFLIGPDWLGGVVNVCKFTPGAPRMDSSTANVPPFESGDRCSKCPEGIPCAENSVHSPNGKETLSLCCA